VLSEEYEVLSRKEVALAKKKRAFRDSWAPMSGFMSF
jgi:hypothetical protein